ncbi:DNA/RNA helicase domain-containing protein, partial [Paenibacillus koleovorans]|uniref:DNA/RNA helicase domain-containing protein n=1 Tax=Paenibacillus koleovorans TaxID=121608 RepID=UPI000FD8625B
KSDPQKALTMADDIIRNTYRTLLTRGQKGCFVYCTDSALSAYLKKRLVSGEEFVYTNFFSSPLMVAEKKSLYDVNLDEN